VFKPEKAKTVLESWKMLNNEKEGSTNGASSLVVKISTTRATLIVGKRDVWK